MTFGSITADAIALRLLHKSAGPLISGDFEEFAACFHLPQTFATPTQFRMYRTREELRDLFDELLAYYRLNGTKLVNRRLVRAEFLSENSVVSIHENFRIGRTGLLAPPLRQMSVLQKKQGNWRVGFCEYVQADDADFCRALVGKTASMDRSASFSV